VVKIKTKDGEVTGTIIGLDAPNVVVRTETGYTVPVTLDKILL
jgi:hypothetical protein